ncbi:hypothetical protein [Burkholderia oklahomensis]|uniref:Electron transfer flavodomain protein n=1 Tax=Burkholderia oklahomensis TaxID=342113 RepID=A0AAI8BDF7_9BURK|nr:hypothetical protein [Burkholderia oklahomensis]AIO70004.1 electron transfer flavodomain protein [Burkholderia oklahomensis]
MANLIIAEHDNLSLASPTLSTIGGAIRMLVAGHNAREAAVHAASVGGVEKALLADAPQLTSGSGLAEHVEATVMTVFRAHSHIVVPASTYGKNIAPRVARQARRCTDQRCRHSPWRRHVRASDLRQTSDRNGAIE